MKSLKNLCFLIIFPLGILTANSQTNSGDLEAYLNNFIDNIPGSSGDDYSSPTGADLINWESAIRDILAGNITAARTTASLFNYIITEYTDTNNLPGQVYYILEEDAPVSKYWGSYIFNTAPIRDNLVLQTPHARYDTNTGDESAYSFTRLSAKAFFIQGTHRCNHSTLSTCDGTTSACDSTSKPFAISDMAHNVSTVFQKTTEIVAEDLNTVFVQLHGFSQGGSDPEIIMSNGTNQTPSGTDNVIAMRDELLIVDPSLTFKIPHIDIGWTKLIATTNTQGRHLNQSNSPCNTPATASTGRFVHIEQAFSLRSGPTGWDKIYVALSNVFSNGCATDNTPPVLDCQDLTVQLDASGNGTLTQSFLNSLATEDCSSATVTASKTSFVCADVIHSPANKLVLTGVVEGDLNATNVKAVEVTVLQDIQDLSNYGIGSANNGGGTDGEEFTFPVMSASKGDQLIVTRDNTIFNTFFGFSADFVDTVAIFFNGDDAIELFYNGNVIDRYGEPSVDGTGEIWEYTNGWAYRVTDTDPDGTTFISEKWTYSGINANLGATTNAMANPSFPIQTYQILPNSQPIFLEATDDSGNISNCIVNLTVEPFETVYSGGVWSNGNPNNGVKARISEDYNTSIGSNSSLDACSCEIDLGKTLTIAAGDYLDVETNILVNGSLIVEHEGSLVQVNEDGVVTNNGLIEVKKSTSTFDDPTDFTLLSSPMTSEKRDGVYASSAVTMNHITANFIPHPLVEALDPAVNNFADDDGNNWIFYTSNEAIVPGVGYLVGGTAGGNDINSTYTQGTLNNGTITFPIVYNGTQNGSPNILGNPYASALDGIKFINDNPIVDAIYYWEHLTAPVSNYPGYRSENWNMGDISILNATGGIAAVNGGSIPSNYIPSGQGFGIKANAAGTVTFNNSMRVTGNNTGYRNTETSFERLYIKVTNQTYALKSSALIGFSEVASNDYDANYDAKRLATPVSIYSILDDKELAIQGRSSFNLDHSIPLGFRTQVEEEQEYTISINELEGELINNSIIFLKDNLLNTLTNLSETDYNFTSNGGNQKNRFVIIFGEKQLANTSFNESAIALYPNPTKNNINIDSPLSLIHKIEIYDLSGRRVYSLLNINKNTFQLDFSSYRTAIYFIKINTKNGISTKRLIKN